MGLGSLGRIEDKLKSVPSDIQRSIDALAAEIRAGRREGSIMTTYEDDEKDVWRQFRRELVSDGIKSSEIYKFKPQIREYLQTLAEEGLLEEEAPECSAADCHEEGITEDDGMSELRPTESLDESDIAQSTPSHAVSEADYGETPISPILAPRKRPWYSLPVVRTCTPSFESDTGDVETRCKTDSKLVSSKRARPSKSPRDTRQSTRRWIPTWDDFGYLDKPRVL